MHPADHMSMLVVYSLAPNKTSGGRYHNVTTSAEQHLKEMTMEMQQAANHGNMIQTTNKNESTTLTNYVHCSFQKVPSQFLKPFSLSSPNFKTLSELIDVWGKIKWAPNPCIRCLLQIEWLYVKIVYSILSKPDRNSERPSESKVCKFELSSSVVDQKVLGLQISMKYVPTVAIGQATKKLVPTCKGSFKCAA